MKTDFATLKRIKELSKLVQGKYILDIGCRGTEMNRYLNPEIKYYGLEKGLQVKSSKMIKYLPDGITDAGVKDIFNKQKFDTIILAETLEHIPNPLAALTNIRHLLDKGGKLVGSVPNGIGWRYFFFLELLKDGMLDFSKPSWDGSEHFFTFNKYVLRTLLMYSKFKVISIKEWGSWIPHTPIFLPINRRGSHLIFLAEK